MPENRPPKRPRGRPVGSTKPGSKAESLGLRLAVEVKQFLKTRPEGATRWIEAKAYEEMARQ